MMRTHKFLSCHGKKTDSSGIRLFCSNQEQRFAVHVRLSLTGSVSWGYLRDECLKALTLVSPILQKMGSIYSNTVIGPFPLAPAFFLFCSARVYWPIIYFFLLKLIKICSAWINYAHKYFLFFFLNFWFRYKLCLWSVRGFSER